MIKKSNPLPRAQRRRLAKEAFKNDVQNQKNNQNKENKPSKKILFSLFFLGFFICFMFAFVMGMNLWIGPGFLSYIGWASLIIVIVTFVYVWVKKRKKTSLQRGSFFIIPLAFFSSLLICASWVFLIESRIERNKLLNTLTENSALINTIELWQSGSTPDLSRCDNLLQDHQSMIGKLWQDDIPPVTGEIDVVVGSAQILYSSGCEFDWAKLQNKIDIKPIMWATKNPVKTNTVYRHLNKRWPSLIEGCDLEITHYLSIGGSVEMSGYLKDFCDELSVGNEDESTHWPGPVFFDEVDINPQFYSDDNDGELDIEQDSED